MLYEIINLIAENRTFAIAHNGELNPKFRVRSDTDQSTSVTIWNSYDRPLRYSMHYLNKLKCIRHSETRQTVYSDDF